MASKYTFNISVLWWNENLKHTLNGTVLSYWVSLKSSNVNSGFMKIKGGHIDRLVKKVKSSGLELKHKNIFKGFYGNWLC